MIDLGRRIRKAAEANGGDPFLIAMAERARLVQESFEQRQTSTAEALDQLLAELAQNEARKQEQAEKGFDDLTFFVYRSLLEAGITNPEAVSTTIKAAFVAQPTWRNSEKALRELRQAITFAVFAECDSLEQVSPVVDGLFRVLEKAERQVERNG